jgi:hypothetical protein
MRLAGIPPSTLGAWLSEGILDRPHEFRKSIRELRKNEALRRLEDLGCSLSGATDGDNAWDPVLDNRLEMDDPEQGDRGRAQTDLDAALNDRGMTVRKAWQAATGQLQMEIPRASYDTWVRDAEPEDFTNGDTFVLAVGNAYARDWLQDRIASTAERALTGIIGRPIKVQFVVPESFG